MGRFYAFVCCILFKMLTAHINARVASPFGGLDRVRVGSLRSLMAIKTRT